MIDKNVTEKIIGCAMRVHTALGPGLLESVYESALAYELNKSGFTVEIQKAIPVQYDSITFDQGFKADIIVNNEIIIELKSVKKIEDIHLKQLLTYLKLSGISLGLLINFNEVLLKNGIKRIINDLSATSASSVREK